VPRASHHRTGDFGGQEKPSFRGANVSMGRPFPERSPPLGRGGKSDGENLDPPLNGINGRPIASVSFEL